MSGMDSGHYHPLPVVDEDVYRNAWNLYGNRQSKKYQELFGVIRAENPVLFDFISDEISSTLLDIEIDFECSDDYHLGEINYKMESAAFMIYGVLRMQAEKESYSSGRCAGLPKITNKTVGAFLERGGALDIAEIYSHLHDENPFLFETIHRILSKKPYFNVRNQLHDMMIDIYAILEEQALTDWLRTSRLSLELPDF